MKKLLLLILAFLLSFSMVACDIYAILDNLSISSSSSTYDDEDLEEEEEEEDEEEEQQSSSSDLSHIYGEDTTVYSNEVSEDGATWIYGGKSLKAPTFTNYYHGYQSALTMTFDDGYDIGTGRYVNSIFEQYGFRGTMMLGACFLESEGAPNEALISQWNTVLAEGYLDVGCHGYDHLNPVGLSSSSYKREIDDAIAFLRTKFPGQRVLTFATPYAHIDDPYETYLKDHVIANRLEAEGGLVKVGEDYNLYRVKSYSFRRDIVVDAFNQSVATRLNEEGTWVVELIHCVLDSAYNSTDISKAQFSEHCAYIYNNYRNTVWVASFEDVSIYLKQVESAKINYVASDRESITVNVTCPLDEEIYNYPMTIKLRIPSYATSAYAVIDGETHVLPVTKGSGVNTVIVQDIPVNGENVKIYIGGNENCANGCAHRYSNKRVSATCESVGYMLYECIFCKTTYKNEFSAKRDHDFADSRTTLTAPTLTENGVDTQNCQVCGETEEIVTALKNLAPSATISASDGINEWVYTSDMIDGNAETRWVCGTATPSVQLMFTKSDVQYVEITISRYSSGQTLTLDVSAYDGESWTDIAEWTEGEETDVFTLKFEVGAEYSSVKFEFAGTSSGCLFVYEINAVAKIDK